MEGCESPLSSSWDSEPETDISSMINCDGMPDQGSLQSINLEENYLDMEEQNQFVGVENSDDGLLWEMDNRSYEELLKKFLEKEEELRVSNFKLTLSEQEIIKLNVQVENSDAQLDNVSKQLKLKEEELLKQKELSEEEIFELKIQIEKSENRLNNVNKELKRKEEELKIQKELLVGEVFKLQKQIAELDTHIIPEFSCRITNLVERHEVAHEKLKILNFENENLKKELEKKSTETHELQGQLKVAQENMAKSELELVSNRKQIQMLGDSVIMYESKAANYEQEVQKLNSELLDLQAKFSLEKDELHLDIASSLDFLSKLKIELTSQLVDCQSRNKELEMVLEEEINCLREELGQKMHLVEAANKETEMVVIERDEANAKIDKLEADVCSRDDELSNIKKCMEKLQASLKRHLVNFETLKELMVNKKINMNERKMWKLRVEDLEKEVSRQNGVISDKDEEKREAIRQLCYSLEHCRSGYHELLMLKEEELNKQKELFEEEIFELKIQIEKSEKRLDTPLKIDE
ncbi:protein NETWORKED 4B-like [Trifolium pratense]|nr:protein NETWORKED 4B-like [Trifolium pratense]